MNIINPIYYSGVGKRNINEDFLYPENPDKESKLYLVCDGLGGMAYGELASKITALAVQKFFESSRDLTESVLADSIHFANNFIREFAKRHPKTRGMSSTIAMLVLNKKQFHAAWVGDSRIYHIRNGEILFRSKDHSYNEWLAEQGVEEDTSGLKHIITQAVGSRITLTPGSVSFNNIKQGDYFLLITDGILEGVPEKELLKFFDGSKNNDDILQEIVSLCSANATDNHTLYILKTH